jgi:hypothetical protein
MMGMGKKSGGSVKDKSEKTYVSPVTPFIASSLRTEGLGYWHVLADKSIIGLLKLLDEKDLVAVGTCSRVLYVLRFCDPLL